MPIPVAVRSKAWVCAVRLLGLLVRITPRTWVSVSCECCVLSGRGFYRADHSSRGVLSRSSIMRRPWPTKSCWAMVINLSSRVSSRVYLDILSGCRPNVQEIYLTWFQWDIDLLQMHFIREVFSSQPVSALQSNVHWQAPYWIDCMHFTVRNKRDRIIQRRTSCSCPSLLIIPPCIYDRHIKVKR